MQVSELESFLCELIYNWVEKHNLCIVLLLLLIILECFASQQCISFDCCNCCANVDVSGIMKGTAVRGCVSFRDSCWLKFTFMVIFTIAISQHLVNVWYAVLNLNGFCWSHGFQSGVELWPILVQAILFISGRIHVSLYTMLSGILLHWWIPDEFGCLLGTVQEGIQNDRISDNLWTNCRIPNGHPFLVYTNIVH